MSYSSTVIADGAVGYWRLGESSSGSAAADAKGNSNGTYTNTGGITVGQTGIVGGAGGTAVKFASASTSYVSIPDVSAQHVGDTFTIEAWVKLTTLGTVRGVFSHHSSNGPAMYIDSSNKVNLLKAGVSVICTGSVAIADTTTFHHCVVVKNASTSSFVYLDGVDVSGTVTNAAIANASAGYVIGGYTTTPSFPMNGTMCEVALYPTALSSSTVSNHYNLGITLGGFGSFNFGGFR